MLLKKVVAFLFVFPVITVIVLFTAPTIAKAACSVVVVGAPIVDGESATGIVYGDANSTYGLGAPNCTLPATVTTGSTGTATFTITCTHGSTAISAGNGTDSCGFTFDVMSAGISGSTGTTYTGGGEEMCGSKSIKTAIGCLPVGDPGVFTGKLLTWGLGIGGGIAFVLMVYAGYMIITSSGMPQRLQAGKELLTSAITGLLLMIFAVFLLRVLGVQVLGIPGL